jgi:tRNA G18 (ribose-2'-O)-methylase SpoU
MSEPFADPLYLVCENIRSLYNVGAIFRTADAAGVTRLYLCGYTPQPPRREISKVALGAEESVPWEYHAQGWRLVEQLKRRSLQVVALENRIPGQTALDYRRLRPRYPLALLIGNEVTGLSSGLLRRADQIIELPMRGQKESLNVSVACGIALFELNGWRR